MLVLVDDFVGTGNQATEAWESIQGVINDGNQMVLAVLCGTAEGIQRVEDATRGRLNVVCNTTLGENRKIFSKFNSTFTPEEKTILRSYCSRAGSQPEGYGNCQLALVFYYRAPNNVISILRTQNAKWKKGLFVRNF